MVQQLIEAWDSTTATLPKKRERLVVDVFNDLLTFKRHVFTSHERKEKEVWGP
jgi:hypothetical protein